MKLTDVLALAKLGYTAEDVKTFLADNSEETESTYKAELEKIQKESSGKDDEIKNVTAELENAKAEIESLKKQITEIQTDNGNKNVGGTEEKNQFELIKEFFKGGDI